MRIGTLARRTGTNVPTIRYYESIGLLPRAARQEGRQRVYGEGDVERLTFIRRCREFGFSVEQVRSLDTLGRDRSRSCLELRDLAATHLSDVRARIRELEGLAVSLEAFVETCDATCVGGAGPDCTILEDLSRMPRSCSCSSAAGTWPGHRGTPADR
jgi:DNA-binding transcriptional MerR regulator